MTTTRRFSSADAGAPVLNGTSGSLIALLHACLVGTAGVAYGSKAAAGWTEPFTNTSTKGVWRNSLAAGGTGCYCRVLDNASFAAGAMEAGLITYQAMSDIDTGIDPAPATATLSTGAIVRKSSTADATARAWEMVADEISWYLNIRAAATIGNETSLSGGGDILSEVPGDNYRYFAMGRNTGNSSGGVSQFMIAATTNTTPSNNGLYIGRNYASTGTSISLGIPSPIPGTVLGSSGVGLPADPAPGTNNTYFFPTLLVAESSLRGRLRGVYTPGNNLTAQAFGSTLLIGGNGSTLLMAHANTGGSNGVLGIETALEW